jgi:hypothetical protein
MKALKSLDIFNNWWYGTPIKKKTKKGAKNETNKTSKFDLRGLGAKRRSKK